MAKKKIYTDIVSVRLTENEKHELEQIIEAEGSNKSDFLRIKIQQILMLTNTNINN